MSIEDEFNFRAKNERTESEIIQVKIRSFFVVVIFLNYFYCSKLTRLEGQLSKYTNVMRGYQFRYFVVNTDLVRLDYFMVRAFLLKSSQYTNLLRI